MMPRDGRNRKRRPIDQVLRPSRPSSPQEPDYSVGIPKGGGKLSPVDTVLGGGEEKNPWVNPFMEVYEKTKVGAMENLGDLQKQMSESFAHRGGYFGGKHAIAQGEMAAETGTALDQLLAQTQLGASERQYQDWQRARGETMGLMNLLPLLLGTESFQNIVQMPGPGAGETIGNILGAFAGGAGAGATGGKGG